MADFALAYSKLALIEGLYSNDPNDPGGETVCGISRVYWPHWDGWGIVDTLKKDQGFPGNLKSAPSFIAQVHVFYREHFWDRFCLDDVDQALAYEVFEQAVNLGVGRMTRHLQRTLNALNHQNKFGEDLLVDGAFGPRSLQRMRQIVTDGRSRALQYGVNGLQCAYYVGLGLSNLSLRRYTSGWLAQRGEATGE
jgi:lysozyme family protein